MCFLGLCVHLYVFFHLCVYKICVFTHFYCFSTHVRLCLPIVLGLYSYIYSFASLHIPCFQLFIHICVFPTELFLYELCVHLFKFDI